MRTQLGAPFQFFRLMMIWYFLQLWLPHHELDWVMNDICHHKIEWHDHNIVGWLVVKHLTSKKFELEKSSISIFWLCQKLFSLSPLLTLWAYFVVKMDLKMLCLVILMFISPCCTKCLFILLISPNQWLSIFQITFAMRGSGVIMVIPCHEGW